jgi:hypothetical protein
MNDEIENAEKIIKLTEALKPIEENISNLEDKELVIKYEMNYWKRRKELIEVAILHLCDKKKD